MTFPICPCDGADIRAPVNPPALSRIAYRVGTYADFRRAVLTPTQPDALSAGTTAPWRTDGAGDLAVMIAEWFAYIADILAFYNERIANQDYLRTADLPESVAHLIALLGYRPRPAIGATGQLAALVTAGQSAMLPKGLQFQSKPGPGQPPQTFELTQATPIGLPDRIPAVPPPRLLAPVADAPSWNWGIGRTGFSKIGTVRALRRKNTVGLTSQTTVEFPTIDVAATGGTYRLRLAGAVNTVDAGAVLLLARRDAPLDPPLLATVQAATIAPAAAGGKETRLTVALPDTPPDGLTAAQAKLERANQSASLWTLGGLTAIDSTVVHLASLVRQIRPNDWVLLTQPNLTPVVAQVSLVIEEIWNASTDPAVPVPHTVLELANALPDGWDASATVHFGWISVGTLLDQPFDPWSGTPSTLLASSAQDFPLGQSYSILLQDSTGAGIAASGSSVDGTDLLLGALPSPAPPLQPPFTVLPNVLKVTHGKTVASEVLGSSDATSPAQSFRLKQSPVTYLQQGAAYASTITLTVGGQRWIEVASFYGQPPDATVFVTREDDEGKTHVMFGDGVNGARLPTGTNNVVATYRIGAGAASPPAGKLTVVAQSYPGLRAVLNPVAVGGGAEADPPDKVRRYAPRSVLTFGRAVSVFDFEAIAALTPGVTRARAVWAWSHKRQRALVMVYVGDDAAAAAAAKTALTAAGDPNRPVEVVQAAPVAIALWFTLTIAAGRDPDAIRAGILAALTDADTGLFGAVRSAIGRPVFDSEIEATVLAVPGAIAITASGFTAGDAVGAGPLHDPGEGAYYALDPADIILVMEPDAHGG